MASKTVIKEEWVLNKNLEMFITDEVEIEYWRAQKLCKLFEDNCEVAYVARYRGDVHGGMNCEQVRKAYECYQEAIDLNKKVAKTVKNVVVKIENVEEKAVVADMIKNCQDQSEVTEISKMYTVSKKKTKATIAREHGFEDIARNILQGQWVDLKSHITKELKTIEQVEEQAIISLADMINKMETTLKCVNNISKLNEPSAPLQIVSSLTSKAKKSADDKSVQKSLEHFKEYTDFNRSVYFVQDHQILALERAENNEIINWKVDIDIEKIKRFHPYKNIRVHPKLVELWNKAVNYSISKLFIPKLQRATRRFLSQRAQNSAIKCFSSNIEQLFAKDGLKNVYVIALDPGFSACKSAFLKPNGDVIETTEFRLQNNCFDKKGVDFLKKWSTMSNGLNIVIAIGNGKGTYETQSAIAYMIDNNIFPKKVDISFCVVPEDGASKYSVTELAASEFPGMEPTQISAVSIGRRLIDPMAEYVKIDPQHLGKGMYQHSVNTTKLSQALDQVVREVVSMRGVDVNCASEHLLRHICGLNKKRAAGIIEYRTKMNGIKCRQELMKVPGLGDKSFVQCAGFLTVSKPQKLENDEEPVAKKRKKKNNGEENEEKSWNPLDETIIHPDQYEIAERVLKKLKIDKTEVMNYEKTRKSIEKYQGSWAEEEQQIIDLLLTEKHAIPSPPLLKSVRKMNSLKIGTIVSGVVQNHTSFGMFVDIGVERSALAHCSSFRKGEKWPEVGTNLSFKIQSVDQQRGRIGIQPVQ